jgi:ABC-type dipeptide/oligopeptide/nickel transport system permease component
LVHPFPGKALLRVPALDRGRKLPVNRLNRLCNHKDATIERDAHNLISGALFGAIGTVIVAHATAYVLVALLPQTGVAILGIGAANTAVLEHYGTQFNIPRSYPEALLHILTLNLGDTLDGVSVSSALIESLARSAPILAFSMAIITASILIALFKPGALLGDKMKGFFEFLTFLPADLPAFLLFTFAITWGPIAVFEQSLLSETILGLSVGFAPCCLAVLTVHNGFSVEQTRRYVQFMRACGFSDDDVHRGTRKAVFLYSISSWEKLFTLQIAILIFTEAVFSYPGFGSALVRALQRTDVNFLLASVVVISLSVASLRLLGTAFFVLFEPRDEGAFVQ